MGVMYMDMNNARYMAERATELAVEEVKRMREMRREMRRQQKMEREMSDVD
jgi:hypothetical protein